MQGLLGVVALVGLAWCLSENRARVPWKLVGGGVLVQIVLALLLLRVPGVSDAFGACARVVTGLIGRSQAGIDFVFGPVAGRGDGALGFVFAFQVLPIIIFFAALMAVLYHVGVMQVVIRVMAWLMQRLLGVSGTEAMCMAANIFVGQTEAPLTIKPYIDRMTRAQLMTLMVGGFATIAGSVLVAYTSMLGGADEEQLVLFAKHLITASVLSAPAAFVMARILVPETETPEAITPEASGADTERAGNVIEAAAAGASDGLRLALNVGAMLIAFLALLAVIDWPLEWLSSIVWGSAEERLANGDPTLSLEFLLGWALAPLAWLLGVSWADAPTIGSLLGQKLIVTEFIAFGGLRDAMASGSISDRSAQIAAYALCGFANCGSLAIQIGGLSGIAPQRRSDFADLALRAMIGGAMASFMTAAVAGLLL